MSAVFEVAADPLRDVFVDHHRSLLRMAASVLQGADDPEDVVHDAWLRCWSAAIGPAPGFELAVLDTSVVIDLDSIDVSELPLEVACSVVAPLPRK